MSDIGLSDTHTDIVRNVLNAPFITLTESKINNHWYHETRDEIFQLTSNGFRVIKGSKKVFEENNWL